MTKKHIKKGFTLIELVVVIAVIAILAAVSVVTYVSITRKARQSADEQTVAAMNSHLKINLNIENPTDAFKTLQDDGIYFQNVKPQTEGAEFALNLKANKVVLLKDDKVIYPADLSGDVADANKNEIWRVAKSTTDFNDKYSYYLGESFASFTGNITCAAGLDVGSNKGVGTIKYVHTTAPAQEVVIRTTTGALNISGYRASEAGEGGKYDGDTVHHYSYTTKLDVVNLGDHCYYEHGTVREVGTIESCTFVATETAAFCETPEQVAAKLVGTGVVSTMSSQAQYGVADPIDPFAGAPAEACYAFVTPEGDVYYSKDALKEAYAGSNFTIVMLKDATNQFEYIYNSTITFDLNGHSLTLTSTTDGFGSVKSTITIMDSDPQKRGTLTTWALEVMNDAKIIVEGGNIRFTDPTRTIWGGMMAEFGLGGPIEVKGGTFNADPTSHLVGGHTATESDGIWTVQ